MLQISYSNMKNCCIMGKEIPKDSVLHIPQLLYFLQTGSLVTGPHVQQSVDSSSYFLLPSVDSDTCSQLLSTGFGSFLQLLLPFAVFDILKPSVITITFDYCDIFNYRLKKILVMEK